MSIVDSPGYAAALRRMMLRAALTVEESRILEAGRVEAGAPPGRYPWPCRVPDHVCGVTGHVEPEPPPVPDPPTPHRAQVDLSVADQVAETDLCPVRAIRPYRPDPA